LHNLPVPAAQSDALRNSAYTLPQGEKGKLAALRAGNMGVGLRHFTAYPSYENHAVLQAFMPYFNRL
jgi:hypothetical protein